jgi:hypothetical protein
MIILSLLIIGVIVISLDMIQTKKTINDIERISKMEAKVNQ